MKKLVTTILLISLGAMLFASATLTFSGRYALIGSDRKIIQSSDVDIEETGIVVSTRNEGAKAEGDSFTLFLKENSMAAITNNNGLVIYLVYGEASILSKDKSQITVYTPTTRFEIEEEGEYSLVSTDNVEKVSNLSSHTIRIYDGIRNKYTDLLGNAEFDYLKDKLTEYAIENVVEEEKLLPHAPLFLDARRSLIALPSIPEGLKNSRELVTFKDTPITVTRTLVDLPSSPEGLYNTAILVLPVPSYFTVTKTLVDIPEEDKNL